MQIFNTRLLRSYGACVALMSKNMPNYIDLNILLLLRFDESRARRGAIWKDFFSTRNFSEAWICMYSTTLSWLLLGCLIAYIDLYLPNQVMTSVLCWCMAYFCGGGGGLSKRTPASEWMHRWSGYNIPTRCLYGKYMYNCHTFNTDAAAIWRLDAVIVRCNVARSNDVIRHEHCWLRQCDFIQI